MLLIDKVFIYKKSVITSSFVCGWVILDFQLISYPA